MEIKEVLNQIGLDKRQSSIFIVGMKTGPCSVLQLSKKTKINRPTLYKLLDELLDKGLFHITLQGKKKLYVSAEPKELLAYVRRQETVLEKAMPELLALAHTLPDKPRVEYFEGKEQLTTLLWDAVKSKAEIMRSFFPSRYMIDTFGKEEMEAVISTRVKNNVFSKTLRSPGSEAEFKGSRLRDEQLREVRYIPDDKVFGMGFLIYNDTVAIYAPQKENFGLKITSPGFAGVMKTLFDAMWDQAEEKK